jgi:hypothetical protein
MAVHGDNPIRGAADDLLGRSRGAAGLARQILTRDASEGLVIGVLGPWGSGKTSYVNLACERLREDGVTVLDFNPWMFSGAEQLVESFFIELSSQLKLKPGLAEIGKDLEDYGEVFSGLGWVPLVGPWVDRGRAASKVFGKILQRRKEGVTGRRQKLEAALRALKAPVVVVLDDIDRLTTSEIRDIFKLIRLTANFPNVIYLAAFDRKRVEEALAEDGIPGREYLEKILQVGVDLPALPDTVLNRQVFDAINGALDGVEPEAPFDSGRWHDVYPEVVRPLVRHMRDVRRYAAAVHGTTIDLQGQIELVDVLALEAVRVFLPDVFALLAQSVDGLTTTSMVSFGGGDPPYLAEQITALIETAGPHGDVVRALIKRLFPAAERHIGGSNYGGDWQRLWLRDHRVAHPDALRLYLERVVGDSFQSFLDAEATWAIMSDRDALEAAFATLDPDRLEDVVASLEAYQDEFTEVQAVPSSIVLLNTLSDIPARARGMLDLDTSMVVTRVVLRLLRPLPTEQAVEDAVGQIMPELRSLSAKAALLGIVGHREHQGHKLISEAAAAELERAWRAEVRAAPLEDLLAESDIGRIFFVAQDEAAAGEDPLAVPAEPRLTLAILESAKGETRGQSVGNRAVTRSLRLGWGLLVAIYGDEATLSERIDELASSDVTTDSTLLALAFKYRDGWRPAEFGD